MRQKQDELAEHKAQILAVSLDSQAESDAFRKQIGANFPFLSDSGEKVVKKYAGLGGDGTARPTVFLIDRKGRVRWRHLGGVADRPPADTVIKQLAELQNNDDKNSDGKETCPEVKSDDKRPRRSGESVE